MAQKSGFFTAQQNPDGSYDRMYTAEEFAYYFSKFIGNGVFLSPATQLQVSQSTDVNMSVNVAIGDAYINGWWYSNTSAVNLPVRVADGVNPRIDLVVLRWDGLDRTISLDIVEGVPSANPIIPELTRNEDIYELCLARIELDAVTTAITNTIIKDVRSDSSVCGFVHGLIDQIDATNLFQQFQAKFDEWYGESSSKSNALVEDSANKLKKQFEDNERDISEWFNNLKEDLSEDVAIKLRLDMDELRLDMNELKGTTLISKLLIGDSTVTFSSNKINSNSTIDIYTDDFSVFPLSVEVEEGELKIEFEVQSKIVNVKVVVK